MMIKLKSFEEEMRSEGSWYQFHEKMEVKARKRETCIKIDCIKFNVIAFLLLA